MNMKEMSMKESLKRLEIMIEASSQSQQDIFRKRPILGNRILTPIREESEFDTPHKLMSSSEAASKCCQEGACREIEVAINEDRRFKHSMWVCFCKEKKDVRLEMAKRRVLKPLNR